MKISANVKRISTTRKILNTGISNLPRQALRLGVKMMIFYI